MKVTKWNGKPISKPGWYSDIPIERYHSAGMCVGPAVSSSNLRTCWSKSPAHMYVQWAENPNKIDKAPTSQMLLGAISHHLMLGEDGFKLKYIPYPATYRDKVTAAEKPWHNGAGPCKEWVAKQEKAGKIPFKGDLLDSILEMVKSMQTVPLVQSGALRGRVEHSGFWKDSQTGLWIKVRPDVIPVSDADFVDLKTAADVTTVALMSSIRSYGYHMQGSLIWEVCEQLGQPFESFWMMFIETAAPYCARAVKMNFDDLGIGRQQNRWMLNKIANCIDTGIWPGPEGPEELRLSSDERERIEARFKFMVS